jgi:hypothetical protein
MPRIGFAGTFPASLEQDTPSPGGTMRDDACAPRIAEWLMPAHVSGGNATFDAPLMAEYIRRGARHALPPDMTPQ